MFINQEIVNWFSFYWLELAVDMPVVHLRSTDSDQFSKFVFNIFMVKNFEIINFISSNSSVKSDQQRFEKGFSSFQVEVHDLDPEKEG